MIGEWIHICLILNPKTKKASILLNSFKVLEGNYKKFDETPPSSMQVGSDNYGLEFTEFRLWKDVLDHGRIYENMKMPL